MVFETRWVAPAQSTVAQLPPPPPSTTPPPRPAATRVQRAPTATATTHVPPSAPDAPATTEPAELLAAASKTEEPSAPARAPSAASTNTTAVRATALPPSVRLLYDIKGETKRIPISAQGELNWRQDGKSYDARLEIRIFLLGSRVQTSKGLIGPQGLEPVRFGDKVRSEVAAHFERGKGKVSYSANTPDEPLLPGAQDQLSIFFQLAGMLAAEPERYPIGSALSFQAVGPRSSETWVFKLTGTESLALPGGQVRTLRLSKDPVSEYDSRAEVWLAPELDYLPVRIRLTQSNGDLVDQLWRATERPVANP